MIRRRMGRLRLSGWGWWWVFIGPLGWFWDWVCLRVGLIINQSIDKLTKYYKLKWRDFLFRKIFYVFSKRFVAKYPTKYKLLF